MPLLSMCLLASTATISSFLSYVSRQAQQWFLASSGLYCVMSHLVIVHIDVVHVCLQKPYSKACLTAGMAVFDTMRYVKSDVSTVCVGLAASMGAFILASGQKVHLLAVAKLALLETR